MIKVIRKKEIFRVKIVVPTGKKKGGGNNGKAKERDMYEQGIDAVTDYVLRKLSLEKGRWGYSRRRYHDTPLYVVHLREEAP
jgi:hypothetical protein